MSPSRGPPPKFAEIYKPNPREQIISPNTNHSDFDNRSGISGINGLFKSANGPIVKAFTKVPTPGFCLIGIQSKSTTTLIQDAARAKLQPVCF
jgi:hypothetical protein